MPIIEDEQRKIEYTLTTLSDVHFIKIYLDDLNGVQVTAPAAKPSNKVDDFLHKKTQWMNEKWQKLHHDLYETVEWETEQPVRITYLGRSYQVIMEAGSAVSFHFSKGKFYYTYLEQFTHQDKQRELERVKQEWLKEKAEEKFSTLHKWTILPEPDKLRLGYKDERTIYLNWRLIQRSKQKIATVIDDLIEERTY
ncbi:YgjP-like metallopeptidase domain-containing protein [Halobacillus hunanensis]|uniref:YgjP-like metallopeptidase domain-containing protein n=1 Tax=Halobacillus hunanensis TaxID=578214 RepID=UPI0009A84263|nr:YgjP-like metallopeptidase domain-containing protein [Halobacillus hunanensis]